MEKLDVQDLRNMFDHLFLGQVKGATAQEITNTLQATGLESLDKLIQENRKE
jgi:hypothetical protein